MLLMLGNECFKPLYNAGHSADDDRAQVKLGQTLNSKAVILLHMNSSHPANPATPATPATSIKRRTVCRWLAAPLVASASLMAGTAALSQKTPAQDNPPQPNAPAANRYRRTAPSADGIGKVYMGREIAGVMGWQGAAWLEREERQQPEMIQMLTELAKKAGLANIKPVLGAVDNVKLADGSVDLAIMVDVYHELEFPFEVMQSLVRALKPGGRVVFVEYRAEDARVPIKALHKMTEAQVRKEAAQHALVYERTASTLPWQHVVIFRKN